MRKVLKWIGYAIAIVVVVVAVAIAAAVVFVDPNDYRDEIAAAVERQTGRAMSIDGELDLTFFPHLGVSVGDVSLADAPGFGDEPFVTAESLTLGVAVWPLLSGDLQLDTVTVRRPQIRLIRNSAGEANWQQFGSPSQQAAGAARLQPAALHPVQRDGDTAALPAVIRNARLAGVEVIDARVLYRDETAGMAATVDPFDMTLEDVRFGAPVSLEASWQAQVAGGPALDGTLTSDIEVGAALRQARAEAIELSITASGEAVPAGEQTVTVTAELAADLAGGVYRLTNLAANAAEMHFTGEAEVRAADQGPVAAASLALTEVSPRAVLEALAIEPPETRDSEALGRIAANAEFRFANGALRVEPLKVTLDDTTLEGHAEVNDFTAASPAVVFQLAVNRLDVDRYLPPPAEGEEPVATPGGGAAAGVGEIPVDTLRALRLDGRLTVDELIVSGARANDVEVVIRAADGRIRVHPLAAALYGGRYRGDVQVDATGDSPRIRVDEQLSGVQAEPLLGDVADFDKLLGIADVSLQATTEGRNTDALLAAMNGQARFEFRDGAVKGFNIAQMLRQGVARFRGEQVPESDAPRRTDFSALTGTLELAGATVRNRDLEAKTPLLRITGEGRADLMERSVDYNLTVNVVDTLAGQGGAGLGDLRRIPVPLRIRGPFAKPEIELALGEAMKDATRARIAEEKEALEQKAKEEVERKRGELMGKLKSRLGGADDGDAAAEDGAKGDGQGKEDSESGKAPEEDEDVKERIKGELEGLLGR